MGVSQWINININERLRQGISLINSLDDSIFTTLLNQDTLTESDLLNLQSTLKLKEGQLQLLLQTITYIYKQSSRVMLKPAQLLIDLKEVLGIETAKAELFVKKWSEKFREEVGDFEERHKLDSLSWELNVQSGSDMESQKVIPEVRVQLNISKVGDPEKRCSPILQLRETELQQLYNTLETIQLRMDDIRK